jgi:hypothetical protein
VHQETLPSNLAEKFVELGTGHAANPRPFHRATRTPVSVSTDPTTGCTFTPRVAARVCTSSDVCHPGLDWAPCTTGHLPYGVTLAVTGYLTGATRTDADAHIHDYGVVHEYLLLLLFGHSGYSAQPAQRRGWTPPTAHPSLTGRCRPGRGEGSSWSSWVLSSLMTCPLLCNSRGAGLE